MAEWLITVDTLCIEITRRCNMKCKHCLRGGIQNQNISDEMIDKLLSQIYSIDTIVFTGGEISLYPDAIWKTLSICKKRKIPIRSFYAVTNGKKYSEQMIKAFDAWYLYCYSFEFELNTKVSIKNKGNWITEDMRPTLALSLDPFHEPISLENIMKYQSRSYFNQTDKQEDINEINLLNRGRARDLSSMYKLYDRPIQQLYLQEESIYDESSGEFQPAIEIEQLYLACDGVLLSDCDMSYKDMKYHNFGNIQEAPLQFLIQKEYDRRHGKDAFADVFPSAS